MEAPIPRVEAPIPRVEALIPMVETPILRVTINLEAHCTNSTPMNTDCQFTQAVTAPQQEDQCALQIVPNPPAPRPIDQAPTTCFQSGPHRLNTQSCLPLPNFISQDKGNNPSPTRGITRLASRSIMQKAMLSCVDIYKPQYIVSADLRILNYTHTSKLTGTSYMVTPKQMTQYKLLMKWLCEMANSVLEVTRELLKYHHLIFNQTTRATWKHSYGNEIGLLA
jgi:hypothetical protein